MTDRDVFDVLKARYCLAAIAIGMYWQPGLSRLEDILPKTSWYDPDLLGYYYSHAVEAVFLLGAVWISGLALHVVLGRGLHATDIKAVAVAVVLLFCAPSAVALLIHVPLSYSFPDFYAWWSRQSLAPLVAVEPAGTIPVLANILGFASVVVISPLLQESIYRGYLLHRWSKKWGLWPGVIISSAVFGAVHADPLTGALGGVVFAVLYLKTRTLWAPIVAHCIVNFLSWLSEFYGVWVEGQTYYDYNAHETLSSWWNVFSLFVVLGLGTAIFRHRAPPGAFGLPSRTGTVCLTLRSTGRE